MIKAQIVEEAKKYVKLVEHEDKESNSIKNAFVVFRSMEGAARVVQAYNKSKLSVCCIA